MTELSNWGKWGKEDQAGTINLITAAKRKSAAALVREGVSVSMSLDAGLPRDGGRGTWTSATRPPGPAAEKRRRWTYMLSLNPLRVPGATGSAVNPVAIFRCRGWGVFLTQRRRDAEKNAESRLRVGF